MNSIVRQLSCVLVLSLAACGGSSTSTSTAPKTSVATVQAADLNVELLTDSRLEVGMTPVYVKVTTASGAVVKDATVTMTPLIFSGALTVIHFRRDHDPPPPRSTSRGSAP